MKSSHIIKAALASSFIALCTVANAQFNLPSIPGIGGSKNSAPAEDPAALVANVRNSMSSFVNAKIGLIEAMGGSDQVAAQKQLLEGLKKGDAAASKEDLETIVSLDKATNEMLAKKTAENAKLDAQNKAAASKAMLQYVSGLVSSKKVINSISGLTKNPMALLGNLGAVTYLAKEMPSMVSSGASTTSTLFTYLGANGVDISEAKKAASDLGV